MIDAATFSTSYNAFWRAFAPTCELFVRRLNLDGYERFEPPMAASKTVGRRALIAEYAFSLFVALIEAEIDGNLLSDDELQAIAKRQSQARLIAYASQ